MILLAFALSLDAFAVSVTSGVTIKNLKIRNAFKIAAFFGGFQALMPSESRGFTDSEGKPLYGKYRGYSLITECEVIFEINKYWGEGYEHANESSSSGWYDDSRILKTIPELPKNIIWNDHIYLYPIINCVRIEGRDYEQTI